MVTGGDSTDMPIPFNVTDDLSFDTILNDSLTSFRLDLSQPQIQQPLLVDKTGIFIKVFDRLRNDMERSLFGNFMTFFLHQILSKFSHFQSRGGAFFVTKP